MEYRKDLKYIMGVYIDPSVNVYDLCKKLTEFVEKRIGYHNTFEVHESKEAYEAEILRKYLYDKDIHRFVTTIPANCYIRSVIIGYDFNPELGMFYIKVEADEKFDARGTFYPRLLINNHTLLDKPLIQVVGLDYVKGKTVK